MTPAPSFSNDRKKSPRGSSKSTAKNDSAKGSIKASTSGTRRASPASSPSHARNSPSSGVDLSIPLNFLDGGRANSGHGGGSGMAGGLVRGRSGGSAGTREPRSGDRQGEAPKLGGADDAGSGDEAYLYTGGGEASQFKFDLEAYEGDPERAAVVRELSGYLDHVRCGGGGGGRGGTPELSGDGRQQRRSPHREADGGSGGGSTGGEGGGGQEAEPLIAFPPNFDHVVGLMGRADLEEASPGSGRHAESATKEHSGQGGEYKQEEGEREEAPPPVPWAKYLLQDGIDHVLERKGSAPGTRAPAAASGAGGGGRGAFAEYVRAMASAAAAANDHSDAAGEPFVGSARQSSARGGGGGGGKGVLASDAVAAREDMAKGLARIHHLDLVLAQASKKGREAAALREEEEELTGRRPGKDREGEEGGGGGAGTARRAGRESARRGGGRHGSLEGARPGTAESTASSNPGNERAFLTDVRRPNAQHARQRRGSGGGGDDTARSEYDLDDLDDGEEGRGGQTARSEKQQRRRRKQGAGKDHLADNIDKVINAVPGKPLSSLTPDEEARVAALLQQQGDDDDGGGEGKAKTAGEQKEEAVDGIDALEKFGVSDGSSSLEASAPFKRLADIDAELAALGFKPPPPLTSSAAERLLAAGGNGGDGGGGGRGTGSGPDPLDALWHEASVAAAGVDVEDEKACGTMELEIARRKRAVSQRVAHVDAYLAAVRAACLDVADRNEDLQAQAQQEEEQGRGEPDRGKGGGSLSDLRRRSRKRREEERQAAAMEAAGSGAVSPDSSAGASLTGAPVFAVSRAQISMVLAHAKAQQEQEQKEDHANQTNTGCRPGANNEDSKGVPSLSASTAAPATTQSAAAVALADKRRLRALLEEVQDDVSALGHKRSAAREARQREKQERVLAEAQALEQRRQQQEQQHELRLQVKEEEHEKEEGLAGLGTGTGRPLTGEEDGEGNPEKDARAQERAKRRAAKRAAHERDKRQKQQLPPALSALFQNPFADIN